MTLDRFDVDHRPLLLCCSLPVKVHRAEGQSMQCRYCRAQGCLRVLSLNMVSSTRKDTLALEVRLTGWEECE